MTDRAVSVGCVVAYVLWSLAVMMLLLTWLIWDDQLADHLGRTSLVLCGAAITATVRVYFVAQNRIIRSVLAVRDSTDELLRAVR